MLSLYVLLLLVGLIVTWRMGGALWLFCFVWLICCGPIALGAISYSYLFDDGGATSGMLIGAALAFALGCVLAMVLARARIADAVPMSAAEFRTDFETNLPLAKVLWFVGLLGMIMQIADLASGGISALANLDEIRESVVTRQAATIFGRLAVLLSWANMYVYLFALIFRRELGGVRFAWLASAAGSFFLCGLLIAGRQAAFQLILLTILGQFLAKARSGGRGGGVSGTLASIIFGGGLVAYMAYIAVARVDQRVIASKEAVLRAYFKFDLSPGMAAIVDALGSGLRSAFVEALVYFTHSVALFDRFVSVGLPERFYGATSFPLLFRQIQGLTGISPEAAYRYKVQVLDTAGYAGVGWSTGYSSLYIDFGAAGTAVALTILGATATFFWDRAHRRGDFSQVVIAALLMVNVVYLPLLWGFSDQNLFVCLIFACAISAYRFLTQRTTPGRNAALARR